jgi:hypothetical protein
MSAEPGHLTYGRVMMETLKLSSWILAAIAGFAALGSTAAQAEYRCAKPAALTYGEVRACELARRDTPAALIHFVNRTKGIYGLDVNDYVSVADVDRWETSKQKGWPESPTVAKGAPTTKAEPRTE